MTLKLNKKPAGSDKQENDQKPSKWSIDWKQHPVIIAVTSAAAAIGFAWQLILPIETARLKSKIDLLQSGDESRKKTEVENALLRIDNKKLMLAVHGTALEVPFIKSSPYATGYEDIRIGGAIAPFIKPTSFKPNPSPDDPTFQLEKGVGHFAFVSVAPIPNNRTAIGMIVYANQSTVPGFNSELIKSVHGSPTLIDKDSGVELWKMKNDLWYMVSDLGISILTPSEDYLKRLGYPG